MKINMIEYTFEYKPTMSIEQFIKENEWYFIERYLEEFPQNGYKINDWDTEGFELWCQGEYIENIVSRMAECYTQRIQANYM